MSPVTMPQQSPRTFALLCLVVLVGASACRHRSFRSSVQWTLQATELQGSGELLRQVEGSWGNQGWTTTARISANPAQLTMRLPEGYGLVDAVFVGDAIHYTVLPPEGGPVTVALTILPGGLLVITRPGEPPSSCGTCTPYLRRITLRSVIQYSRPYRRAEDLMESAIDRLARVL